MLNRNDDDREDKKRKTGGERRGGGGGGGGAGGGGVEGVCVWEEGGGVSQDYGVSKETEKLMNCQRSVREEIARPVNLFDALDFVWCSHI